MLRKLQSRVSSLTNDLGREEREKEAWKEEAGKTERRLR
jgi:outer membrane murein-binding lipoprotein Lpp